MSRNEITTNHAAKLTTIELPIQEDGNPSLSEFIINNARLETSYLLAHADDGVIWGKVVLGENGARQLRLAPDSVPLSWTTLQSLKLFNPTYELSLWQSGDGWCGRIIEDAREGEATWKESYEEKHLLWGTRCVKVEGGFCLLEHGIEGLRHSVPLPELESNEAGNLKKPVSLLVRHYLNLTGPARVDASRLVNIIQR